MIRVLAFLLALAPGLAWGQSSSGGCQDVSPCPATAAGGASQSIANWLGGPLSMLARSARNAAIDNLAIAPAYSVPAWAASTTYGTGDTVSNGGNYYTEDFGSSCTSAGSGGPSGTGSQIADNTCIWHFIPNPIVDATLAPTVTVSTSWAINQARVSGQNTTVFTGSGATAVGNIYTETVASCTTAGSGTGPSGTGTGIVDNTCSWNYVRSVPTAKFTNPSQNSFVWNSGTGAMVGKIAIYGGTPATSGGTGYEVTHAATVAGAQSASATAFEWLTDASVMVIRTFVANAAKSNWRFAVCQPNGTKCRWYSVTPYYQAAPFTYTQIIVDFSAVGGHALRDIYFESDTAADFGGVDIYSTDDLAQPNVQPNLTLAYTGDSYMAGGGLSDATYLQWSNISGRTLGVRNIIGLGIGGTGYLVSSSSGTALSRLSDVTNANNGACADVLIEGNGTNDIAGFTNVQITAAMTTYLQAVRAACPKMTIFKLGVWAHDNGGASYAAGVALEAAEQTALAVLGDSNIFWVPVITDASGSWQTGTGTIAAPNGSGNTDWSLNTHTNGHLNGAGNYMFDARFRSVLQGVLASGKY